MWISRLSKSIIIKKSGVKISRLTISSPSISSITCFSDSPLFRTTYVSSCSSKTEHIYSMGTDVGDAEDAPSTVQRVTQLSIYVQSTYACPTPDDGPLADPPA